MEAPIRPEEDSAVLKFLYHHGVGRLVLRVLSSRTVSKCAGLFLDSSLSKGLIKRFRKRYEISLEEYEPEEFRCFNDFFCRKVREERRPVDRTPEALIAPCDGLLSAYRMERNQIIPVKQSRLSLQALLADDEIYREYEDGMCLVFRLCVNHYHRYCYVDSGVKGENRFIKGKLHTVRPVALCERPVFTENCREYTIIDTENFGRVVQMEVGAMLVGKIQNYHGKQKVSRGQEKGRFLYGGSTVIVLLKKDAAQLPHSLFQATKEMLETPVKLGEKIGIKGFLESTDC